MCRMSLTHIKSYALTVARVGHHVSVLTETPACAPADRVSGAVSGKGVDSMCNVAPDMPVFQ